MQLDPGRPVGVGHFSLQFVHGDLPIGPARTPAWDRPIVSDSNSDSYPVIEKVRSALR
jgi:hypothetical protein